MLRKRWHSRQRRLGGGKNHLWMLVAGAAVIGGTLLVRYGAGGRAANAGGVSPDSLAASDVSAGQFRAAGVAAPRSGTNTAVAIVDGRAIARSELIAECLKHYGRDVLESVTNKYLIAENCRERNVVITPQEVEDEIQQNARRFRVPVDQMLSMLQSERNISREHYANDIVWPTLALRKLAAGELDVTDDELVKAFETRFGAQVKLRLISCRDQAKAEEARAKAMAAPDDFARLAGSYSNDIDSASAGGLIPPLRKHLNDPHLEEVAFALHEGEISQVIHINNQYVILKCEGHIPARPPSKAVMAAAERELRDEVRDRKLRTAGTELFHKLQQRAKIQNVMNDPVLKEQMPGVAATVNGQPISIAQLGEECVARYGREVLAGMITRTLLENALVRRQLNVGSDEIDAEIARAAVAAGVQTRSGKADIKRWIAMYTRQEHTSEATYRSDVVWPSVALKKLAGSQIEVTEEDMHKAFEANYGPRVRCRAIVLDTQRQAQQVWDMARRNPTVSNFAQLAGEYSVEPGSRALKGEVPPIRMHCGQPNLEQEAFALKPGDVSGVIQMADKFVILFCEGQTKPEAVKPEDVADLIREDIREKKTRLAMARQFEQLQAAARIDNLIDPKASHTPEKSVAASHGGGASDGTTRR